MCGIAGIIHRHTGQLPIPRLERAAQALRHRGPDDVGIHVDGKVGLIHTRLAIIDQAGGHQPLLSPDDGLALVANGEVYNYVELFAEWASRGRRPRTHSDSEAILHAYAEDGVAGIGRLHGMFAFALHDARRGALILGRDRFGIKPLFYVSQPDCVIFASELRTLLTLLPATPALHTPALLQYLENGFSSGDRTILEGVRRIPPGHCLTVDPELRIHLEPYYALTAVRPEKMDLGEAASRFNALMSPVMAEHMRADVSSGLFLSGGVDSAILCAYLSGNRSAPLSTYALGYVDTPERNELDDAERISRIFGTRHHTLLLDTQTLFRRIPHAIHATDELMLDHAMLPTSVLAEHAAREHKVIFSGEGGDEVFAGYGRYRRHPLQRFLANLAAPGSGGFRTRGLWPRAWRQRLFGGALQVAATARQQPFIGAWQSTPPDWSTLQRAQFTDLQTALPDNLLVKLDRATMGFGLEGRVPFLDHRIVEFGLSLPDALKIRGGVGKYFLRQWASHILPREHLFKAKRGFHVPVSRFFTPAVLKTLLERLPRSRGIREYFVPEGVAELVRARMAGKPCTPQLWAVFQFALWYRMFIEGIPELPGLVEDPLVWLF